MGKHTYLYPLEDGELWLWRAARMGASDLFSYPVEDAPLDEWVLHSRLSDALGEARDELHTRLESRDRICIGRHYVIPGSLYEVSQSWKADADRVVREVTRELWDAPYFYSYTWANTLSALKPVAGRDGRDSWEDIAAFYSKYQCTKGNGKRFRVVPVWM